MTTPKKKLLGDPGAHNLGGLPIVVNPKLEVWSVEFFTNGVIKSFSVIVMTMPYNGKTIPASVRQK